MSTAASDIIRKTALTIIAEYPNGLRFTDLKFATEEKLSNLIPPDDKSNGKFRSALWDLDKRYPDYVKKEKKGRMSVFFPTHELIKDKDQIIIPVYLPTSREKHAEHQRVNKKDPFIDYVEFKAKVLGVIEYIESLNIHEIDLKYCTHAMEMKNVARAMIFIEGLKGLKYSMQYVREDEIRY